MANMARKVDAGEYQIGIWNVTRQSRDLSNINTGYLTLIIYTNGVLLWTRLPIIGKIKLTSIR